MIFILSIFSLIVTLLIWVLSENKLAIYKIFSVICIVLIGIGIRVNGERSTPKIKKWETSLENLKDGTFIQGSIRLMLGSGEGEINQEFEYTMYAKTKVGAKLLRIPINKCTIIYSDKPVLETIITKDPMPTDWRWLFYLPADTNIRYVLKIPKNTIDSRFELDAQ